LKALDRTSRSGPDLLKSELKSKDSAGPLVSVITPLYNSSAFIGATLDSLLAQTYTNWESILVDDGSTDDTARAVEPYLADTRFKYVRQRNQGIAGARNTGLGEASGEWVCLLDHDDRWLPSKLEKQLERALADGCDIVCTDAFIVTDSERWIYSRGFLEVAAEMARSPRDRGVDAFGLLIRVNFICTCSVMLRRSLFDERGVLDAESAPADDYEMWLRCMPEARIGFVGEPLVEYVVHGGNYSKDEVRMTLKIIHVLGKHRRLHAGDRARARQFDDALAFHYGRLFTRLALEGRYGFAARRALRLLVSGGAGARIFYRTICAPLLARVVNSIQYRLGSARM
jgi:glycosyltransferase involved in cell wall biosynthesis